MNETYAKLMMQQSLSKDADAMFYQKLENANIAKKRRVSWKVAVVAACILLMIPVTVLAVEYLIHEGKTEELRFSREPNILDPGDWYFKQWREVTMVGYEIEFSDMERFSIKDFPRQVRKTNGMAIAYDSWNEAVEELDIGILKNTTLAADDTKEILNDFANTYGADDSHCVMEYVGIDDQPYKAKLWAKYVRDHIEFTVNATAAIHHPTASEESYESVHRFGESSAYRHRPKYEEETYTTVSGIPVTIVKATAGHYRNSFARYTAYFAVNNISYSISTWSYESGYNARMDTDETPYPERARNMLIEVLEGFTLE